MNKQINYQFTSDVSGALKGFKDIQSQLETLGKLTNQVSTTFSKSFTNMSSAATSASKKVQNFGDQLTKLGNSMRTVTKSTSAFSNAVQVLSGAVLGKALADSTKEAIDFVETMNLFKVAMKDSIKEGQEFIATLQEMYGLDPNYLAKTTGLFYEMAYAVDMPAEAAKKLSMNMTAAAVDIGSLFNVDFQTVADNLTSGIRGMSRAVIKYGMDVRASTVEAYANAHGITAQFETMSEANREILRYLVMMEQASDANKDFANTVTSPANQLRILKEQIVQFGRAVGNFIVQPLSVALPYITGFVMAIRMLLEGLAELLGFMRWTSSSSSDFSDSIGDATSGASAGIGSIGDAAADAEKKVKSLLAPFDELNVLSQDTGSAGAGGIDVGSGMGTGVDPALLKLLEESSYELGEVKLKANEVRDAILEFMGIKVWQEFDESTGRMITKLEYMPEVFENNLIKKLPGWEKSIHALFDVDWSDAWTQLKNIASTLGEIAKLSLTGVVQDLMGLFNINDDTLSENIGKLNENLRNFSDWLTEHKEDIVDVTTKLLEFFLAWQAASAILGFLAPVVSLVGTFITVVGMIGSTVTSVVSAAISGFSLLSGAISSIMTVLSTVLTPLGIGVIGAFVAGFIAGFTKLWDSSQQFRDNISTMLGNLMHLVGSFVDLVINVVSRIKDAVWPLVNFVATLFEPIVQTVMGILNGVIGVIQGFLDILNGILTGDVTLIFKGFMKVLMGLVEAVMNLGAGIVNAIIAIIVGAINFIGETIYTAIKAIISFANSVGDLIGFTIPVPDKSLFVVDNVPQIVPPAFDYAFAKGGVVTGPTRALIGEGQYDEAVIPLGESPQLEELVNKIGQRVDSAGETIVKVFIGDKEWDAFTYKSAERGKKLVGAQPIKEGA